MGIISILIVSFLIGCLHIACPCVGIYFTTNRFTLKERIKKLETPESAEMVDKIIFSSGLSIFVGFYKGCKTRKKTKLKPAK